MATSSGSSLDGDTRRLHTLGSGDASGALQTRKAASDPKAAIRQASKQFEALFMQQLVKSMREATLATGMLDNGGTQLGTEMLDTQYANQLTGIHGGLSDMIARQLERQSGIAAGTANAASASPSAPPSAANAASLMAARASASAAALPPDSAAAAPARADGLSKTGQRQAEFLRQHQAAAKAAEAQTGIPATFMVAQAAHESGWGKHEIRNADGSSSYNLFGVKAGSNWTGKVAQVTTTEVVNGQSRQVTAKFRAYGSYAEAFGDYAQMMKDNPRYAKVVAANNTADGFAQGLQRAGYATDPAYADKLSRVINTTLRLQRAIA